MQENINGCFFEKCVYVSVENKIIEAASIDESQSGKIIDKSDWREIEIALAEAVEGGKALTILLTDMADSSIIKWIAIITDIEKDGDNTTVDFIFFEELKNTIPSSTLTIYGNSNVLGDSFPGIPALCKSPELVNDYLNENNITKEEDCHEFFFNKCVYVSLNKSINEVAEFDDNRMGRFVDGADWGNVASLLEEAKEEGKLLNIIFSEKSDSLNISWIAIIDEINNVGKDTTIQFGFIEELETPVPVSTLSGCDGENIIIGSISIVHNLCDSPAFLNSYLQYVFGGTSIAEFRTALSAANVTTKQREMLNYHYQAPGHIISMATMARLMGYKNFNAANLHYGKFAARIAEQLGCPVESGRENIGTLAFPSETRDGNGHFQWEMHSELAQALEELGWVEQAREPAANCLALSQPG